MLIAILRFLIPLLLFSCSGPFKKDYFEEEIIIALSDVHKLEDPLPMIVYNPVFIRGKDGTILKTSSSKLELLYVRNYKDQYHSFESFLKYALNQKTEFDLEEGFFIKSRFKPDPQITALYENNGLTGLTKKYCSPKTNNPNNYNLNRRNLGHLKTHTIYYYFFLNNYFALEDDVNATVSFKPMKEMLNRN